MQFQVKLATQRFQPFYLAMTVDCVQPPFFLSEISQKANGWTSGAPRSKVNWKLLNLKGEEIFRTNAAELKAKRIDYGFGASGVRGRFYSFALRFP